MSLLRRVRDKDGDTAWVAWASKKGDLLSVLGLLLLCTIFFGNVLFTERVLVSESTARYYPWKYYATQDPNQMRLNDGVDRVLAEYPQRVIAREMVAGGTLPLWNPYSQGGVPLLAADPLRGFAYPFNIILYAIEPLGALGYASFLQLFLAATFMYFYLTALEIRGPSAFCGAVIFGLGGFFLLYLFSLDHVNTAVWMPLMFLSVERILQGRSSLWALALAFAVGMAGLSGHYGVVVYELLAVGLYCAYRYLGRFKRGRGNQGARIGGLLLAGVSVGALLAAVQLIPTLEALPFIERAHISYEERFTGAPDPRCLAMAILPDIFGNPADNPGWGRHAFGANCPGDYSESSLYAGLLPLALGVTALALKRNSRVIFFGGLAVFSVAVFLDSPVYKILWYLPIFRYGRAVEAKILYFFCISVLAALGLNSFVQLTRESRRRLARRIGAALCVMGVSAIGCTLLLAAIMSSGTCGIDPGLARQWYLYNLSNLPRFVLLISGCSLLFFFLSQGRIRLRLFIVLAISLIVADLFCFGWRFNPPQNPRDLYSGTEGIQFLQADSDLYRVIRGPGGRQVMPPSLAEVYGISDAQVFGTLILDYYGDFMDLVEHGISERWGLHSLRRPESTSSRLLDLLNVKYILSRPEGREGLTAFAEVDENIELVYQGDMRIYENKNVLPRAFVVAGYKVLRSREEIFAELTSEDFDPAAYVILEQEPELRATSAAAMAGGSSVVFLEYTPSRVTLEARTSSHAFLVLSDLYYPGWKAFVDGDRTTVYKADYILRAVELEEGRHLVQFVYDPSSFKLGLCVTALSFLAMCSWLVAALFRMKVLRSAGA